MKNFSKFLNCDRVICVVDVHGFSSGKVYKCSVHRYYNGVIQINIDRGLDRGVISFSDYYLDKGVDYILETFRTILEHRKAIIEELIEDGNL